MIKRGFNRLVGGNVVELCQQYRRLGRAVDVLGAALFHVELGVPRHDVVIVAVKPSVFNIFDDDRRHHFGGFAKRDGDS